MIHRPPARNLSMFDLVEGRVISALEQREPGIVRRLLDEQLASGLEPSREHLRKRLYEELEHATLAS